MKAKYDNSDPKNPFVISMSVDELNTIRYLLHEGEEKVRSRNMFFGSMSKTDKTYVKFYKNSSRDMRGFTSVLNRLKKALKSI